METLSGENLRLFRKFLGWINGRKVTQKDMAKMLGTSDRYVKYAEAGKRVISTRQLKGVLRVVQGGQGEQMASGNSHKMATFKRQGEQKIRGLRPIKIGSVEATQVPVDDAHKALCKGCNASGVCPEQIDLIKRQKDLPSGYAYIVTFCPYFKKKESHQVKCSTVINFLDYVLTHHPEQATSEAVELLRSFKTKKEHSEILQDIEGKLKAL